VDIPVSVYKRLSRIPNIAGVKEASTDIGKFLRIFTECGNDFTVWTGNDEMIVPTMALGAQGVISVLSNLFPAQVQNLTDACLDGDYESARLMQAQFLPMTEILFSEVNPIPVKAALKCLGLDCGCCRMPLTDASDATFDRIRQLLQ
jgi:4-hydroxy-tetrahydrodipicolinate synthase